ncbi:MAG: Do family serine endopeptidase [Verrucomicrobiaceae bacterium]
MKFNRTTSMILAGTSLLGVAALVYSEDAKSKLTSAELEKKITRDTAEIRNANNPSMSGFADVVERILPSVVSINTYSKKAARKGFNLNEDEMDQLPPMLRPFFEDWLQRHGNGQMPNERNRQAPQRPQKPVQTGLGSGMLLSEDGYILTNNHVVDGADEIKVMVAGKGKEYAAKVIGADPSTDVALIKIEGTGLPHATIGDSAKLRVGDVVLAVGAPMGLEQSVTHGIVSALGRSAMGIIGSKRGEAGYENFIQTDAAINPGNSGGPLVDTQGRVIGINSAIETQSGMFAGIGLAIPINMAMSVVHDLVDTGKVERGFLGIQMDPVEPSMSEFLGLKDENGVTVTRIVDGSPAAKAGFEEGDVIVSADDQKIADPTKLRLMISSHHPGVDVKFGIVRFNEASKKPERKDLVAKLEKLPEKLSAAFEKNKPAPGNPKGAGNAFLEGVKVEELNDDLRQNYKIEADVQGVVVTNVDEKSAAAKVGLQEGDVITQVNRKAVSTMAEARSNKGEAGGAVQLKVLRNGQTKFIVVKS